MRNCLKTDKYRPLKYLIVLLALAGIVLILISVFTDNRLCLTLGLLLNAIATVTNIFVFQRKEEGNDEEK